MILSGALCAACGGASGDDGDVADCADLEQRFLAADQVQETVWLQQATEADCLWALDLAAQEAEIQAEQQQRDEEATRERNCQLQEAAKEQLEPITSNMRQRADELEAQGMHDLAENTRRSADAYEAQADGLVRDCS